jgi:type IV secretion system protein VirB6
VNACALLDKSGVIRGVLQSVDCQVQSTAESGYRALTGPGSVFPAALTAALTIYIAFLGYGLLFGASRVSLRQTPILAVKVGLVLTFALNWTVFQTLVFNLSMKAPLELAQTVARPSERSGAMLASDPLGGLQVTYDQLGAAASTFGKMAGPNPQALRGGEAATADGLWKAQAALFSSTAGLISIAIIATGVLSAFGPVFITLGLFEATRGLFIGWLRALIAAALIPAVNWLASVVMLIVIEPSLIKLAQGTVSSAPSMDTAASIGGAVLIFAMAQVVLAIAMVVVACGLRIDPASIWRTNINTSATPASNGSRSRVEQLADSMGRRQVVSSMPRTADVAALSTSAGSASAVAGQAAPGLVRYAGALGADYRRSGHFDRLRQQGPSR